MPHYKNEKPSIPLKELIKNTRKSQGKYISPVPTVMGVVKQKDKFLVVKKKRTQTTWGFITGFVEAGESIERAIEREVEEETGVKIKVKKIIGTFPYFDVKITIVTVLELQYISGKVKANDDVEDAAWIKLDKNHMKSGTLGKYVFSKWFSDK